MSTESYPQISQIYADFQKEGNSSNLRKSGPRESADKPLI
jgi:hypothetical protein